MVFGTAGLQQQQPLFLLRCLGSSAAEPRWPLISPPPSQNADWKFFFGVSDRFKEVEQNDPYSLLLRILRNQIPSAPFLGWGLFAALGLSLNASA